MEFKYADAPRRTKSMTSVIQDLNLKHVWVVYPGNVQYPLAENITVLPLAEMAYDWNYPS